MQQVFRCSSVISCLLAGQKLQDGRDLTRRNHDMALCNKTEEVINKRRNRTKDNVIFIRKVKFQHTLMADGL